MLRLMQITALVAVLAVSASVAWADLTPVGNPIDVGSWAQGFYEDGVGNFDLMAVQMTSPDQFEPPAFRDFSNTSWHMVLNGATLASATGNALNYLSFNIAFSTDAPLTFDFVAYNGTTWLQAQQVEWVGSGGNYGAWNITDIDWHPDPSALVPAPAAVILGMLGLGLVGWVKRRVA